MNEPHDLDPLLMQRAAPRVPHDLADRIVYRAVRTPQVTRLTFKSMIGECMSFLVLPRPALAFGLCLMLGMFSGWATTQNADADNDTGTQVLDLVVIEEEWL